MTSTFSEQLPCCLLSLGFFAIGGLLLLGVYYVQFRLRSYLWRKYKEGGPAAGGFLGVFLDSFREPEEPEE
jgi:hypothetical protein